MFLVFDTETTGIANFKLPPSHPSQPYLVQYAGALIDDDGRVLAAMSTVCVPEIEIPEAAAKIHGIDNAMAAMVGEDPTAALHWHSRQIQRADLLVAHNADFDLLVLSAAASRAKIVLPTKPVCCTMKTTTSLVKALPRRYGSWKWPSLQELHQHLFGCGFSGAHDALEDVRATARCYLEIKAGVEAADRVCAILRWANSSERVARPHPVRTPVR